MLLKTKLARIAIVSAGLLCAIPTASQAGTITTLFASNNGQSGNMFNATTFSNALTITGMDLNLDPGTWNIEVYTKSGSYVGSETNGAAWTLVSSNAGIGGAGTNAASFVDLTDFVLPASSINGLYVTVTNGTAMNYTNGGNTFSNADLQLSLGVGKSYAFGSTFSPRTWNGTIYYDVDQGPQAQVSEPSTLALIGLGLAGLGFARRKRNT